MKTLDANTIIAIQDRSRIIVRNFIWVAKGLDAWGFTDYGEDVAVDMVDAITGNTVSRTYFGDYRPIVAIDPLYLKIGLEVDTTQVVLNQLHEAVEDMVRGHDIRHAVVQIHRAYLDPASMLPVAALRVRRLGQVNGAPIDTPAVGGEGGITIKIVSNTRELTRTNPAKRSDEQQKLRSGDRFRRYTGVMRQREVWWGELGEGPKNPSSSSRRRK